MKKYQKHLSTDSDVNNYIRNQNRQNGEVDWNKIDQMILKDF